jgi:hypothetical protein
MKRDWLREPIVVLPLTGAALFFLGLPVVVFGVQGAPQFYGAFFAAVTGLAGVLVGALYNARLVRERDDRLERVKVLAAARIARSELGHAWSRLRSRLKAFDTLVPIPKEQLEDFFRSVDDEANSVSGGGAVTVERWLHRRVTDFLNKDLATRVTDLHLLELCQQSEAISRPLLEFIRLRAEFADGVKETFSGFGPGVGKAQIPVFDWKMLGVNLDLMEEELGLLIPAIDKFLDAHAGDFA